MTEHRIGTQEEWQAGGDARAKEEKEKPRVTPPPHRRRLCLEHLEDRINPMSITVNSIADIAVPPAGTVTLRSAIIAVNGKNDMMNTISLDDATAPVIGTIVLGSELDTIQVNCTIQGPSAAQGTLTVSRDTTQAAFRIFTTGFKSVAINNLTITNGSGDVGGGILALGNLSLSGDTFYDNTASSGGALASATDTCQLTLAQVDIHSNTATGNGGGIYNKGSLTIGGSSIYSNSATLGGGGIYNLSTGNLNLTSTDIFGNSTNGTGGGILNNGNLSWDGGELNANTAAVSGAGLFDDSASNITIQNINIESNDATGAGGGIYITAQSTVFLDTCFMSGNLAPAGSGAGVAYKAGANFVPQNCTLNDPIDQV